MITLSSSIDDSWVLNFISPSMMDEAGKIDKWQGSENRKNSSYDLSDRITLIEDLASTINLGL